jgi:hypothetical protein
MKNNWLKKGIAASLSLFILAGCNIANPFAQTPTTPVIPDTTKPAAFDSTKALTGIAPYYSANSDIEYYPTAKPLLTDTLITGTLRENILTSYTSGWSPTETPKWTDVSGVMHFYEVGTIKAQTYKNRKLVILNVDCEGPCFEPYLYRFAYDPTKNELVMLTKYSSEANNSTMPFTYTADNTVFYKGIAPPQTIKIPNSDKTLSLQVEDNAFNPTNENFMFADQEVGNLYGGTGTSCLSLHSPDGSTSLYGYNPNFFKSETVMITWSDNSPQTNLSDNYDYVAGACGIIANCYTASATEMKDSDFQKAGVTSTGMDIYTLKNPLEEASGVVEGDGTTMAQAIFASSYQGYKATYEWNELAKKKPMMTFKEFAASKPILYWKDPFNRWASVIRLDVKPAAECGKPVIYLYPEKTTDVNVQVLIDKFTKTIPAYESNGWTVKADPDGTLLNYADGKTYPYLFWEGQKKGGSTVTKGFTVARADVETFLDESLNKLGLTTSEAKDFKDFWLSRMLENTEPYFFISFLGTSEFNKIAPLKISPAPQSLLRVFMYYNPTFSASKMAPQELTSVARKGFTVVEWGGTSSKPWQAE